LNKINKIIGVLILIILFLMSGIISSSANSINKKYQDVNCERPTDPEIFSKTVTLYRFGLNGDVKPIQVEISFNNFQNINEAISEKCEELLMEDIEFQDLNNSFTSGLFTLVKSHGRGIHLLPSSNSKIVYCRYPRDPNSYTTIRPIFGGNSTTIVGPHRVISFGFFGFKWWINRISILGFFLRTGYVGYSTLTTIRKL
jgi:hypothetical protein